MNNGDQGRNEVIVTQSGGVAVKDEKEHNGHNVHHHLHTFHLIVLGLVFLIHDHIDDVCDSHQQTKQADMIPVEGDGKG